MATTQELTAKLRELIHDAVANAKDGLTWAEIGQVSVRFVQIAVEAATELYNLPGESKKLLVMTAIGELYDALAPFIPYPWFLAPLRGILTTKLRGVVLSLASGAVEAVYYWLKRRFPDHLEPA